MLPYLTPKIKQLPRFADIGFDTRNYIKPKILDDAYAMVGKGYTREDLKPLYDTSKARLKSAPAYGVTQAAQLIMDANPGVQVYSGEAGNQRLVLQKKSPEVGGTHAKIFNPVPGQLPHLTLIRDDLDNLNALRTLSHETGHYRMGHSTKLGDVTMPENINGRNAMSKALKEIEAESTAVAIMNRLGYGYAPGLIDNSGAYIARWYNELPSQWQTPALTEKVSNKAEVLATQLVPEPIRRFGPISTRVANIAF